MITHTLYLGQRPLGAVFAVAVLAVVRDGFFKVYLSPQKKCSICDLDFEKLKADDGPAYITMGLVCLFIIPFFFIAQALYEPPLLLTLLISLPLTLVIILGFLPLIKGAFMAALWKTKG